MKVAKIKKVEKKERKMEVEEQEFTIKKFAQTVLTILLVLAIFYIITIIVIKPLTQSKENNKEYDPQKITMNQLLKVKEEEYYVLAVKESEQFNLHAGLSYFNLYNSYISKYKENEDSLNFYWIDMDDAINGSHWGEEFNIDTLTINDEVLFKISDGKIEDYFVGHNDILEELQGL